MNHETIEKIIKELFNSDQSCQLERPDPKFGDYTTNVAMQLAGSLKQPPRHIAETIAERLRQEEAVDAVEIAGPGFINIRLNDTALLDLIRREPRPQYAGQKIVFEYSCPNAFKELHTGHLYQTIFGDIVSRLMLLGGASLQRTSFGGDVGLHVAKCLYGMVQALGGESPEALEAMSDDPFERARWISECYVGGAAKYETDEAAKNEIDQLNKTIYGFHDSDDTSSPLAKIYWTTRQWSFDYFTAFYDRIDVAPQHYYPESQTAPVGLSIVTDQLKKGVLRTSEGAVVFTHQGHTRVFITSKGLPTYETKDVGVIALENEQYQFDHRYLLTGNDQKQYMQVVYAAAETFMPELKNKMTHLMNGTVKFADGSKMSSRLGNVTRALDVIDAVRQKVSQLVENKDLVDEVTLGAIKYAFARYKLGGNISFDLEETVSLHGNSGPYLQYAHARARSILKKTSQTVSMPRHINSEDRVLIQKLGEYADVVTLAQSQLAPHHLCQYLYELAQEFNRYYEKNRVIGSDKEAHRVSLVQLYADTLQAGLLILGIAAPDAL